MSTHNFVIYIGDLLGTVLLLALFNQQPNNWVHVYTVLADDCAI